MAWKNIFHKGVVRPFETWGKKVAKKMWRKIGEVVFARKEKSG